MSMKIQNAVTKTLVAELDDDGVLTVYNKGNKLHFPESEVVENTENQNGTSGTSDQV